MLFQVHHLVICPGLTQVYGTLLRDAEAETVTAITRPAVHVTEHCNVCTSSGPSLAHVQHAVMVFTLIVLSYYSSWDKNTVILFEFFSLISFSPSSSLPPSFLSSLLSFSLIVISF